MRPASPTDPGPDSPSGVTDTTVTLSIAAPVSCRVLLVDDDAVVRHRLTSLLETAGYEVYTASSGKEALRILDSTSCQIVLTVWLLFVLVGLVLCCFLCFVRGKGFF